MTWAGSIENIPLHEKRFHPFEKMMLEMHLLLYRWSAASQTVTTSPYTRYPQW